MAHSSSQRLETSEISEAHVCAVLCSVLERRPNTADGGMEVVKERRKRMDARRIECGDGTHQKAQGSAFREEAARKSQAQTRVAPRFPIRKQRMKNEKKKSRKTAKGRRARERHLDRHPASLQQQAEGAWPECGNGVEE